MNDAQGRVFWSSQYESFDAVEPPFLEVYTNNEAHTLDWYTFSSDMVAEFAKEQVVILRKYAPHQFVTTNFMVLFTVYFPALAIHAATNADGLTGFQSLQVHPRHRYRPSNLRPVRSSWYQRSPTI